MSSPTTSQKKAAIFKPAGAKTSGMGRGTTKAPSSSAVVVRLEDPSHSHQTVIRVQKPSDPFLVANRDEGVCDGVGGDVPTADAQGKPIDEYPGIVWIRTSYVLDVLKDGERMPRCQDLPANAFGNPQDAKRLFALTHPWLARYEPDPGGIQVETLRAKLERLRGQLMLDRKDVIFVDYMCLPQVHWRDGRDDRTAEQRRTFAKALDGDLMGRIFLTSQVLIIDEVPRDAQSATKYLDRGWCFFESVVASMNAAARDTLWISAEVKTAVDRYRIMATRFRDSGDLSALLNAFDSEISEKHFTEKKDAVLVRGFFVSLARSQRLIRAAATGDFEGCEEALLVQKADPATRDGFGRTALQAALLNGRVHVVAFLLRHVPLAVINMPAVVGATGTEGGEDTLKLADESGAPELMHILLEHRMKSSGSTVVVLAIENDAGGLRKHIDEATKMGRGTTSSSSGNAFNVDAPHSRGNTALYYAASLRNVDAVRVLLKAGANADAVFAAGESARECATRLGYADVLLEMT
ncbi:unnamed protein product [Amoebophrya sp. A25]|nr:unnamed protein product [Amoebophrya sp. A25]|eukprot:GSA25T00023011001.1